MNSDAGLVRRLLSEQFPQWADLSIEPVASAGTDNALYRLGEDMVVRLPRVDWALGQVEKEQQWLPRLAPLLPLAVPAPLAMGTPSERFGWHWSVYRWLDGESATVEPIEDLDRAASELGGFVAALQRIDPAGGPPPGAHNVGRGEPLAIRDEATRAAISAIDRMIDIDLDIVAVTSAWEAALGAPALDGPGMWIHGDLHIGNLLTADGRLSAVIDFGGLGVGDPACDLLIAWTLLCPDSRDIFRAALAVDDATWARGQGWALTHRSCRPALLPALQSDTGGHRPARNRRGSRRTRAPGVMSG
ncbi:MAG TPA: aminoglycoside phosphotransferase family protein [Egibacteraceae bacterium]|nr:aminoglycoside phosphotransferase family protein [Egibacteraceae bacterium]